MDLAGTLQIFVVVLLIVTMTSRFLDCVALMVVFEGTLASIITTIIGPQIMIILAVVIVVVVAPVVTFIVVVLTMVIGFIILARWVLGAR
jgi:hypothetical protein